MENTVILVTRQSLGTVSERDAAFGLQMLDKFFHTLESRTSRPRAICFYTEGVKLVTRGSPLELALKLLADMGVAMVACQTCLQHYGLQDQVAVGTVGGMPDIMALLSEADKVITV